MKIFALTFKVLLFVGLIANTAFADEIISVIPDSAMQGDELWVGITGMDTHFVQGSGTVQVYLNNDGYDLYAWSVNPISDIYLEANLQIPQTFPPGLYDLTVLDYDSPYTVTAVNAFTILEDTSVILLSVMPEYSKQGDSLWVAITGQNTSFGQGSYTLVCFNQGSTTICANNLNINSSTNLDAHFELPIDISTGYYNVSVDADLSPVVTLDSGFYIYPDPGEIISVVPDSAYQNQSLLVAITGQNTNFAQGSTTDIFLESSGGRIYSYQSNVISPTYCEAHFAIPQQAYIGLWDVVIEDIFSPYDAILEDGFRILPDTTIKILSIDPEFSAQGENLWVTITGLNTNFGMGSNTIVRFIQGSSSITAQSVNVNAPDILQAYMEIPDLSPIGYWDVYVNDDFDPQMIRSDAFYIYPDPGDIIAVDPDSASPGDNLWVTVTGLGTDFTAGSSTIITYLSKDQNNIFSSTITEVTPTSLNAHFQIPSWAAIGMWDVSVTYNDNPIPATMSEGFNVYEKVAMIVLVEPNSAYRGDNLMVSITGQNTQFGQGSVTAVWFEQGSSTINASSTMIYSQTYLESWFDIPVESETGYWDLWIQDPQPSFEISKTDAFRVLFHCGDTNGDGEFDVSDAVWLLNYIFIEGPPPSPMESGETNCDGDMNISDVVWMINYIFLDGPSPCDSDNDGLPDC